MDDSYGFAIYRNLETGDVFVVPLFGAYSKPEPDPEPKEPSVPGSDPVFSYRKDRLRKAGLDSRTADLLAASDGDLHVMERAAKTATTDQLLGMFL